MNPFFVLAFPFILVFPIFPFPPQTGFFLFPLLPRRLTRKVRTEVTLPFWISLGDRSIHPLVNLREIFTTPLPLSGYGHVFSSSVSSQTNHVARTEKQAVCNCLIPAPGREIFLYSFFRSDKQHRLNELPVPFPRPLAVLGTQSVILGCKQGLFLVPPCLFSPPFYLGKMPQGIPPIRQREMKASTADLFLGADP